MSSEAVKRHILLALDALNLPTTQLPSRRQAAAACVAAKQLRNRLLREHARTVSHIATLRQRLLYDDDNDVESDEVGDAEERTGCGKRGDGRDADASGCALERADFLFLLELRAPEKIVIPLLLAHGLAFRATLLPQLLKLLAAVLLPVPRFSRHATEQRDGIARIRRRCASDELFALLVQCIAPIAQRRVAGDLTRDDVVLLEVVLTVVEQLVSPRGGSSAETVAPFVRMHGIELLLVLVGQNATRARATQAGQACAARDSEKEEEEEGRDTDAPPSAAVRGVDDVSSDDNVEKLVVLGDNSEAEASSREEHGGRGSSVSSTSSDATAEADGVLGDLDRQFASRITAMLESEEQILKWNRLILAIFSHLFASVSVAECVRLMYCAASASRGQEAGALSALGTNARLRECVRERNAWRQVASSRNGAITSTGLVVRAGARGGVGQAGRDKVSGGGGGAAITAMQPLGSVSTLVGARSTRRDTVEVLREVDLRKRGRFVHGMYQESEQVSDLSLLVKLQLARQMQSFVCITFGALTDMLWPHLRCALHAVEQATLEYKELIAASRGAEEARELSSPVDAHVFEAVAVLLHWLRTCAVMVRQLRETVRVASESGAANDAAAAVLQEWHALAGVVDVEHLDCGFALLRAFLLCRELRVRAETSVVVGYLAEMLMLLVLLIDGEVVREEAVRTAASGIASAVLYNEAHIKAVFELLATAAPSGGAGAVSAPLCTLLVATLLQLMERCSFGGRLLLPKQMRKQMTETVTLQAVCGDEATVQTAVEDSGDAESCEALRSLDAGAPEHGDATGSAVASVDTAASTLASEREVEMQTYVRRLAQPRYAALFHTTLRSWRVNDADVNLALTYMLRLLLHARCEGVLFNIAFLIPMREVLAHGARTHSPLHRVCDDVVFAFFNPSTAKQADADATSQLSSTEAAMLSGAQSFLGFEVSLRCARALFSLSATEYAILDERASPQLMPNTALPLAAHGDEDETSGNDARDDADVLSPQRRRVRHKCVDTAQAPQADAYSD